MSVNMDFRDGVEFPHFTHIRQEKQFQNYNNESTYEYKLSIFLPFENKNLKFSENKLIKYKITSDYNEEFQANILLEFQEERSSHGYSLIQESVIDVSNQELVQIPVVNLKGKNVTLHRIICSDEDDGKCITSNEDRLCLKFDDKNHKRLDTLVEVLKALNLTHDQLIFLESEQMPHNRLKQGNFSSRPLVVNNQNVNITLLQHLRLSLISNFNDSCLTQKSLSYDQLKYTLQLLKIPERVLGDEESLSYDQFSGLKVHSRIFQMYGPGTYQVGMDDSKILTFKIRFQDFTASPNTGIVLMYTPYYNILKNSVEYGRAVNCSSSIPFAIESDVDSLEISYTNSSQSLHKYQASAIVSASHMENASPLLVTCKFDALEMRQWWFFNDENYLTWTFSYSSEQNAFTCESGPEADLVLRQWKCNNHFECLIVAEKCLNRHEDVDREQCKAQQRDYCMRSLIEISGICTEDGRHENCLFVHPAEKGLVQCYMHPRQTYFGLPLFFLKDHYMYFRGFDGVLYYEKEMKKPPPLKAILKLSSLGNSALLYDNGEYRFKCEAHSFFFDDGLQWFFKFENGSDVQAAYSAEHQNSTNSVSIMTILIKDRSLKEIICSAPVLGKDTWENDTFQLEILESIPPRIHSLDDEIQLIEGEKNQIIACHANGLPRPKVIWTASKKKIELPLQVLEETTLLFPIYSSTFSGEYECTASNIAGNATKLIKVFGSYSIIKGVNNTIAVVAVLICPLIFVLILALHYFVDNKMKKYREMKEVINLLNGHKISKTETTTNSCQITTDALQLPFDKKYEITESAFIIDRNNILGKGEFGEVYRGLLNGVEGETVPHNCGIAPLKALVSELKIMMYIGSHENLVKLLGAYKKEIRNGVLYVAIELCELGSLESFLRRNKLNFLECPILNPNRDGVYYHSFSSADNKSLCSIQSLLRWSLQISRAMEYLQSKKVIHSDLAARNVLLTTRGDAKVTDFGLSRRTYNYTEYIKTAKDPLPWRWLAIESLKTNTFSSQSDVWSFGITLWEMFSLGDIPYPGLSPTAEFVQDLENGLRNSKPKYASDDIYNLMVRCWHSTPDQRPTFSSLAITLEYAFSNGTPSSYVNS